MRSDAELFWEFGIDLFPAEVPVLTVLDRDMVVEYEEERAEEDEEL